MIYRSQWKHIKKGDTLVNTRSWIKREVVRGPRGERGAIVLKAVRGLKEEVVYTFSDLNKTHIWNQAK